MNKYVFITGATAGFGEACARLFALNGYPLIITGRRQDRLNSLKDELSSKYKVDIQALCFDVRNADEVFSAVDGLDQSILDRLGILINNAGLAVGRNPIHEGEIDDWERMIDTNIKGLLYVTRKLAPILKNNGGGHIFNLGSIAGKEVYPGGNVYCASKHAVDAISKAIRIDMVEYNVKVTNIAPGAAETEFSLVRFKGDKEIADSVYDGFEPLKAEDIAEVIYFAATRPPHVTLNDIVVMPTAQASSTVLHKISSN